MKVNNDQYLELVEKLAEELVSETMEKTAKVDDEGRRSYLGLKSIDYYPEYGTEQERRKIMKDAEKGHKAGDIGIGSAIGAGVGAAAGAGFGSMAHKPGAGAAIGGVLGAVTGAGYGSSYNTSRGLKAITKHDDEVSAQRYAGDEKAIKDAKRMGPQYADWAKKKRDQKAADAVKEAAEALIEAVMYKQAAVDDANEAAIVAQASERALNAIGYSALAE